MNNTIELDILKKEDLYEKYNTKHVKKELINYLIESIPILANGNDTNIIINNKTKEDVDIINLIKLGLKREYSISMNRNYRDNWLQLIFFIIGVIGIFISTLITNIVIKEVILIGGWVFIWSLLEMEIITDLKGKRRRKNIEKLLNGNFILKK